MLKLKNDEFRKKVLYCWLGKAAGGTLGMPCEGFTGPLALSYYDPVPDDMLPNDDLDLQVLWACIMDKMEKPVVSREIMADAWLNNVDFPWDEYGMAIRNLKNGIRPPFSGSYDNWFSNGMGAAIRSELWACLAPGNPELAAKYAYEDACVDHAGDGVWAEVFLAAMESMAFSETNIKKCINKATGFITDDSSILKKALKNTVRWYAGQKDWMKVRELIMKNYTHENFTDVVANLAFMVLGLLHGNGNFSKSICTAVNCGRDTDCTGASVGAFLGIINPDSIEKKWLTPIGRKLVINKDIKGITHPATLDGFTDMVISLKDRIGGKNPPAPKYKSFKEASFDIEYQIVSRRELNSQKISAKAVKLKQSGTVGRLASKDIHPDMPVILKFKFKLDRDMKIKVMFNTHQKCRVSVDGNFAFHRDCGPLAPSFHRSPMNQLAALELKKGIHELSAAVFPDENSKEISWIAGIGDAQTNQWLHDAFKTASI